MIRIGHVEIASDRLSAKCAACHKSIAYRRGQGLRTWNEELTEFRKKHRDCEKGKAE